MARIRTIKPDFWTDGTMIGLSFEARLFYIGTWNFTLCDRGHLPDDPMGLRLRIFPGDDVDAVKVIDELMTAGRIVRLIAEDGRTFLYIPRFGDHQKVDARWNSRCPACTHLDSHKLAGVSVSSGETHDTHAETRLGGEGKGKERKGGEGSADAPTPYCQNHPHGTDNPCRACGDARRNYDAAVTAKKNRPTDTPPRVADLFCPEHPGIPPSACDCPKAAAS